MRRKLIAGNWKMNFTAESASSLISAIKSDLVEVGAAVSADLAICVPAPYLSLAAESLRGSPISLGAQDVSQHVSGAFTGEISASMLKDFACEFVIVGHSERRTYHGESDSAVLGKAIRALENGITPIVCVGETLDQRNAGDMESVIGAQVDAVINGLQVDQLAEIIFAYEPIWAIGTGVTASAEMAQVVHAYIRSRVQIASAEVSNEVRILYGGSMKPENAGELLAMNDIDGGLIGGASLKSQDFIGIVKSAK